MTKPAKRAQSRRIRLLLLPALALAVYGCPTGPRHGSAESHSLPLVEIAGLVLQG